MKLRPRLCLGLACCAVACASSPDEASPGSSGAAAAGAATPAGSTSEQTSGAAGSASGGAPAVAGSNTGGAAAGSAGSASSAGLAGSAGSAGASSAGAGGASNGACASPSLLCDDFEAGNLDQFEVLETGGKLTLDSTHVYSGASSVLLTIPANQRGGFLEAKGAPLFPLTNNTVWGRLMVYFEDLPNGHFDTVRAAPEGGGTPWYNIGGQNKALLFNYYSGPLDCYGAIPGKPPLPLKKWVCWEFAYDGSKNQMTLWVDGQTSYSITDHGDGCVGQKGSWQAPTFGSLRLGQFNAQTAGNQTRMWLDDVALGSSGRIGCPEPSASAH